MIKFSPQQPPIQSPMQPPMQPPPMQPPMHQFPQLPQLPQFPQFTQLPINVLSNIGNTLGRGASGLGSLLGRGVNYIDQEIIPFPKDSKGIGFIEDIRDDFFDEVPIPLKKGIDNILNSIFRVNPIGLFRGIGQLRRGMSERRENMDAIKEQEETLRKVREREARTGIIDEDYRIT